MDATKLVHCKSVCRHYLDASKEKNVEECPKEANEVHDASKDVEKC